VRADSQTLRSWSDQRPGASRFRVLGEFGGEAVLDRESGLVWWRSPEAENISPNGHAHLNASATPPFLPISIPSTNARSWCVRGPGGSGANL
jgi:hypothetical protein